MACSQPLLSHCPLLIFQLRSEGTEAGTKLMSGRVLILWPHRGKYSQINMCCHTVFLRRLVGKWIEHFFFLEVLLLPKRRVVLLHSCKAVCWHSDANDPMWGICLTTPGLLQAEKNVISCSCHKLIFEFSAVRKALAPFCWYWST